MQTLKPVDKGFRLQGREGRLCGQRATNGHGGQGPSSEKMVSSLTEDMNHRNCLMGPGLFCVIDCGSARPVEETSAYRLCISYSSPASLRSRIQGSRLGFPDLHRLPPARRQGKCSQAQDHALGERKAAACKKQHLSPSGTSAWLRVPADSQETEFWAPGMAFRRA